MEFMKKFRIQSDCKISISVHHCFISTYIYKIIVGVIYIILLCVRSIEVTGETRVRTDCLNFDVSLCIAYKLKD